MSHSNNPNQILQPLVLLDVDGVINDLGSLYGQPRPWDIDVVESHGFGVHIPTFVPGLIQGLVQRAEVWWCTTWRHGANGEIAVHLGIGSLPVVDDGSTVRSVGWKPAAARPIIERALSDGRDVYWIEDFYGHPPVGEVPVEVRFVDTAPDGGAGAVLTPELMPGELLTGGSSEEAA